MPLLPDQIQQRPGHPPPLSACEEVTYDILARAEANDIKIGCNQLHHKDLTEW